VLPRARGPARAGEGAPAHAPGAAIRTVLRTAELTRMSPVTEGRAAGIGLEALAFARLSKHFVSFLPHI
jgi:hypothetical protein